MADCLSPIQHNNHTKQHLTVQDYVTDMSAALPASPALDPQNQTLGALMTKAPGAPLSGTPKYPKF